MNRRPLALDDLARTVAVSDPQMSPDGSRVAYVAETIDLAANETRSAVWLAPYDGGEPRRLTSGVKHDTQPRWSPDGRTLAFVSDRAGSKQVYLLPLDGGDAVRITDHPVGAGNPVWSPDGRRIAYLADGADRRGDPVPLVEKDGGKRVLRIQSHRHKHDGQGFRGPASRHLWLVDVPNLVEPTFAPTAGQQLTDGSADDGAPAWSPDGRAIALVSDRSPERDRHFEGGAVHVVDVATGTLRRLTTEDGRAANPSWSPDGRWIAYVGAATADDASAADLRLFIVPADGGEARWVSEAVPRSVGLRPAGYLTPSPPVWAGAEGRLCYLVGTGGSTHLWSFPLPLGEGQACPERSRRGEGAPSTPAQLTAGRHAALESTANAVATRFALLVADPRSPAEVWSWDADRGLRQLSRHNAPLLAEIELADPVSHRFVRPDCPTVEGWLLAPPPSANATGPLPLLVSVHGGPHNYFGETWNVDHQLYAARGYAVLYINPLGSGGYGEEFASAVIGDWGGGDFQDQLAAVDALIEAADPPIDPRRLGILGSSYGGFMTCWAVGQTDRFAVGVAGACISNLISFFGTSDIGATWAAREFKGAPHERLDWYLERSPISHVERVRTPLLLYHGEDDLRCPIEQSEQMFTALHRLGRTVELLRLPGESHSALSSGSPVHRVEARRAILEWLDRYLTSGR